MKSKNKFSTKTGLDFNGKKWTTKTLEFDLSSDDSPDGYGRSITEKAFVKMVGNRLHKLKEHIANTGVTDDKKVADLLHKHASSIEFGRQNVLRILSQPNCEGLRVTFCINDVGEESVILSGYEKAPENSKVTYMLKKEAIKNAQKAKSAAQTSMMEEKGVGKSYRDLVSETGVLLSDFMK
jgi:hypothetical protein